MAQEGNNELSACLVTYQGIIKVNQGDLVSVERAGEHPSCTCVVHIHPEKNIHGRIFFSCMPSSRDVAIVIVNAITMLQEGHTESDVSMCEDAVFYKCGYLTYSVQDFGRIHDWLKSEGISDVEKIDPTLKDIFDDIVSKCMDMHNAERVADIIDRDEFLRDVKGRWLMFCGKIGVRVEEVIL